MLAHAGLPGWIYHKGRKETQWAQSTTQSAKPSTAKKVTLGRAVRAQGARPAREPVGHGGLRTPCFGFGESRGEAAVLYVLYVLLVLPRCPLARRRRAGGAGRTNGRGPATPAGAWGSAPPIEPTLNPSTQLISPCRRNAPNLPRLSTTQGAGRTCALRTHGPLQRSLLCVPLWSFVFFVIAPQGKSSTVLPPLHPSPHRGVSNQPIS